MIDYRQLKSIDDLASPNSPFSASAIRWHVFNAENNGLGPAIVRIGRRVYIDEPKFNAWIEAHRAVGPGDALRRSK